MGVMMLCVMMVCCMSADEISAPAAVVVADYADMDRIMRAVARLEARVAILEGEPARIRDPLLDAIESYDPDFHCILNRITSVEDRLARLEKKALADAKRTASRNQQRQPKQQAASE
jgi:hypothetical protein